MNRAHTRASHTLRLACALAVACASMAIPASANAPDRALLRACVEEHADDTTLGVIGVGDFCTCYAEEVANDPLLTPTDTRRKAPRRGEPDPAPARKPYYSEREEEASSSRMHTLHDGHKAYCRRLLQPGATPDATQIPQDDVLAPLRGLDGLIGP